ncbi:hypothetical protein [Amycolatopsis rifamycinica]|uniref:Uncharacterized protein n=1 Tax=Amycolatopsis rifamycinica TaxID=287986 RepID=A0A066UE93_9PSEU|nr:hypothetical protein [Amycolatopsis rifamycinica]KDN22489.1 hypothetical protein DV20_09550 [Amycolatopsis rifamycinica]
MTTPAAADAGRPLTAAERRRLRGIERGLRSGARGRLLLCLGLDAVALALLAAGIFLALPWLFAGCVAGQLAVCLHLDRTGRLHRTRGNPWPR